MKENFFDRLTWERFEVNGLVVKPIEIRVGKIIVKGILYPDNVPFVPVNSRTNHPRIEKIKQYNKSLVTSAGATYVHEVLGLLSGVGVGVNKNGCYTSIEPREHSTGIIFRLEGAEKLNPDGLFEKLHEIYPELTFSRGKLN
jgi:hypothetical protein